ncbi:MAG: FtsW/RodA/SpoVE family cell cycle protein [Thiovulaceae bacterium]|nr:FtsW/RodA/SpoVE family cell cycle protein [Sulfurimonadaceae bacterium]
MADRRLFVLTSIMIVIGIFMSYSLTSYTVILFDVGEFHFLIRQGFFGILSIFIMWYLAQLDPDIWLHRVGLSLFVISMFLMIIMPFLPASLVSEVGGAKRWIKIVGFSLAPVEFFKIGFIYFLAWSFSRKLGHHGGMGVKEEFLRFFPYAVVFVAVMFIIAFLQNDLGQVVVLGLTLLFMLILAGSSMKFFTILLFSTLSFFVFFIITAEHRISRIISWWSIAQKSILQLFPESIASHLRVPSSTEPYQIGHSLNAIHNGGIFGAGLGDGTFKMGFLSEVHTDFILAGISEELGFIGLTVISLLFLGILQRIFKIANRSKDSVYYLFSLGVGLLLAFAFLINAYGISGLTPIKGISVPFLSYGGSAIIAAAIGVGMVLMASKKVELDEKIVEIPQKGEGE